MKYLMAIDLGSTSLKACIYDLDGNCAASASRPTEKINPSKEHPEWVVWDPDQIWQGAAAAAKEAVEKLGDSARGAQIAGVTVTGMGMDGVPIDENGQHLYPFISWHDPRTEPQARWWREHIGEERTFAIAGLPAWAMTAAMRILWMKEHEPEIMKRARKWLLIEDFLNHKLCGKIATDYSMATCMLLFDQKKRAWSDELLAASGIERSLLPQPMQSGTLLGEILPEAARMTGLAAGTPVILGGHDHICGTLPVGAYKSGTIFSVLGTWDSVLAASDIAATTPEVQKAGVCIQAHVAPGIYAAWGGAPAGESLEWWRKQFGAEAEKKAEAEGGAVWEHLMADVEGTQPGASGVMYLPHLAGAHCPINDGKSRGAFVGLSGGATRGDLLRAVIEGLNYQFKDILDSLEKGLGCAFEKIIVSGGVSKNRFLVQNKADIIGRAIEVADVAEASPLGVAMMAGLGLGLYKSLDEAYERVKRPAAVYEPRPDLTARYAGYFEVYKNLYPALKPINHCLFDLSKK
ncbi:MAG: FGGY family carbohydrate kinase [Candidatus Sumerlaeota bacterium]|nr:FGGY family carbohydrate kinase [Candidatus Sumerlaeota bacterium]